MTSSSWCFAGEHLRTRELLTEAHRPYPALLGPLWGCCEYRCVWAAAPRIWASRISTDRNQWQRPSGLLNSGLSRLPELWHGVCERRKTDQAQSISPCSEYIKVYWHICGFLFKACLDLWTCSSFSLLFLKSCSSLSKQTVLTLIPLSKFLFLLGIARGTLGTVSLLGALIASPFLCDRTFQQHWGRAAGDPGWAHSSPEVTYSWAMTRPRGKTMSSICSLIDMFHEGTWRSDRAAPHKLRPL